MCEYLCVCVDKYKFVYNSLQLGPCTVSWLKMRPHFKGVLIEASTVHTYMYACVCAYVIM